VYTGPTVKKMIFRWGDSRLNAVGPNREDDRSRPGANCRCAPAPALTAVTCRAIHYSAVRRRRCLPV